MTHSVLRLGRAFRADMPEQSALDLFNRWDVGWYLSIVTNGYSYTPGEQSNVVFFPLFPTLTHTLTQLGLEPFVAGVMVSNVALFLATVLLYRLALLEFDSHQVAQRAVILLLCFPASMFHSTAYTEGVFIALLVGALLAVRKGYWFVACLLGYCLALTRTSGILVAVPLLASFLTREDWVLPWYKRLVHPSLLALALVPAGTATYFAFLHYRFGNAFLVFEAEGAWGRQLTPFWVALQDAFRYEAFYRGIFLAAPAFLLASIIAMSARRMWIGYVAFGSIHLLYCLSSSMAEATPRLVSVAVPMYLVWAAIGERWPLLYQSIVVAFSLFLSIFTAMFVNGYWLT